MRGGRSVAHAARAERLRESRLTVGGVKVVRFTPELVEDRRTFARLLDAYGIPRVDGGDGCWWPHAQGRRARGGMRGLHMHRGRRAVARCGVVSYRLVMI